MKKTKNSFLINFILENFIFIATIQEIGFVVENIVKLGVIVL